MIYVWSYIFINAISALLRQLAGVHASSSLILLVSSSFAIIYFHLINLSKLKKTYQACWFHKKDWLLLNIFVLIIWLSAFYSPTYIGASLYTFLYFSILGILGSLFLNLRKYPTNFLHLFSAVILISLVIFEIILKLNKEFDMQAIFGIILACIGGVTGFIYAKQSSIFMQITRVKATQVLAVRFYLTVIFSLIIFLFNLTMTHFAVTDLRISLIVSAFFLIVPLYFSQKGIEKVGAEWTAIIFSATPFLTAVLEEIYLHDVNWSQFIIYLLYILFVALPHVSHRLQSVGYLRFEK